jgi:hypothetical protein
MSELAARFEASLLNRYFRFNENGTTLARGIHPLMYAAGGAFTLYFLIPLLQDNLSWI